MPPRLYGGLSPGATLDYRYGLPASSTRITSGTVYIVSHIAPTPKRAAHAYTARPAA